MTILYIYNSMGLFDVAFLVASWQTPMVVVLAVAKLVAAVGLRGGHWKVHAQPAGASGPQ